MDSGYRESINGERAQLTTDHPECAQADARARIGGHDVLEDAVRRVDAGINQAEHEVGDIGPGQIAPAIGGYRRGHEKCDAAERYCQPLDQRSYESSSAAVDDIA